MKRYQLIVNLAKLRNKLLVQRSVLYRNYLNVINDLINNKTLDTNFNNKISSSALIYLGYKKLELKLLLNATWNTPTAYDALDGLTLFFSWFTENNIIADSKSALIREPLYNVLKEMQEEGALVLC